MAKKKTGPSHPKLEGVVKRIKKGK